MKTSARILILFLIVQGLSILVMAVSSSQVVILSQKMMQDDNIKTLRTLTESYAQTVSSLNMNYAQSQDVIPGIRDALAEIHETLDDISKMKIKFSKHFVIRPLARSSAIKKSMKALNRSVTVLNSYETKTQPAMLKSLQNTEQTLWKISQQLKEEQQGIRHLPWYIASILGALAAIMIFNTLFLVYMFKQQKMA